MKNPFLFVISSVLIFIFSIPFNSLSADSTETRDIFFPTDPDFSFIDSFGDGRFNRSHEGIDIMGLQMAPLYSAVDGYVSYLVDPEASWGYHLAIKDADGYTYHYLHINNDTPGTNDGQGGTENAYAPGIERGTQVKRGQLIAFMGNSGNAESVGHHLHFEIRRPDKTSINPYPSLLASLNGDFFVPGGTIKTSYNINEEKGLINSNEALCLSGSLIKLADYPTVYYCGADSRRYVFPNEKIFYSWYDNFDSAVVLATEKMEAIPLGGNVTYKPGKRMIKLQSSSKVYVVEKGGVLRWVQSAETAETLYGPNWNKYIDDIFESWFMDYQMGETINSAFP